MSLKMVLVVAVGLASSMVAQANGSPIVYTVGIERPGVASGHVIRVAGTITVDDATDTIISSDLRILHESDTPVRLPSLPIEQGRGVSWHWSAGSSELRFVVDSPSGPNQDLAFWFVSNSNPISGSFF